MNLAVGVMLLSVMVLGTAYAAESPAGKSQQRNTSSRHERARLPAAERRKVAQPIAAKLEAVKSEPVKVPLADEKKLDVLETPAVEQTVQLKGVRG